MPDRSSLSTPAFSELDLNADLMRGINDLGFTHCTEVQAETLKHTLEMRDVTVQSQTGTGKTAAFLISIFHLLNETDRFRGSKALIVAPTRELAVQIESDAHALGKYLPQNVACFYGGVGYGKQEQAVADGVDIIIGTPGRLLDFSQSKKLDFSQVGVLVIDEADRLFDMGFYPDIRKIMRRARPKEQRITMLYSATLSVSVRNISYQFMNEPVEIEIQPEQVTVERVEQKLYHVANNEKFPLLLGILKQEKPESALIFCNTKRATELVARKLRHNGYRCEFIIGDLPQKKRLKIIDDAKAGRLNMLCATDVAARGLHVDDLDLVVNYDLPEDPEAYVHRIGRTARAGKAGRAVALACERFVFGLEAIEELIGMKIPSEPVTDALLVADESIGKSIHLAHHSDAAGRPSGHSSGGRHGSGRSSGPRGGSRGSSGRSSSGRSHSGRPASGGHGHGGRGSSRDGAPTHAESRGSSSQRSPRPSRPPREPRPEKADAATGKSPSRESSLDDRIDYYRQKYGEEFAEAKAGAKAGARSGAKPGAAAKPGPRAGRDKGSAPDRSRTDVRTEPARKQPAAQQPTDKAATTDGKRRGLLGRLFGKSREE